MKASARQSGFTLLELLIVIILIALAATIVIASLSVARQKGQNTGIASNLASIRQHAESMHLDEGNYNRVCGANGAAQAANIRDMIAAAEAESPAGEGSAICATPAAGDANAWAVSVQLATDGYWCVDTSGFSGRTDDGLAHANDLSCE